MNDVVSLQIVAQLKIVIYDHKMFIVHATRLIILILKFYKLKKFDNKVDSNAQTSLTRS